MAGNDRKKNRPESRTTAVATDHTNALSALAKIVSTLPLFAGLLFIGLTDGKRAFHDLVSGAKVKDDKQEL
jgi:hypothetical protein